MRIFRGFKLNILIISSILLICMGGVVLAYAKYNSISTQNSGPVTVIIKPGMSTYEIGELLLSKGLIKSSRIFTYTVLFSKQENALQAGEYVFSNHLSVKKIIEMMVKGDVAYQTFTVPEGFNIDQIAILLEQKNIVKSSDFKFAVVSYATNQYGINNSNVKYVLEGFLFPDTYRINKGSTSEQILAVMLNQFEQRLNPQVKEKIIQRGLSIKEFTILASIVEKEAKVEEDRPIIAGIFLNRLKIGMPLQSCATVQYILEKPKAILSIKDTEINSPYNTYLIQGLPPGPIASPGVASMNAVLNPANTDYLYFVANAEGKHYFSKTYEEHLAAIDKVGQ